MVAISETHSPDKCGLQNRFLVETRRIDSLESEDIRRWERLADRALEPNPFQEPSFVLPLVRYILRDSEIILIVVSDSATGEWMSLGVFEDCVPTPTRPLRYLKSLISPYSFLDSLLVDRVAGAMAIMDMLNVLAAQRRWHAIEFAKLKPDTVQQRLLNAACVNVPVTNFELHCSTRPKVEIRGLTADCLMDSYSKGRRKSLRRARRWLEDCGDLKFRISCPSTQEGAQIDRFLSLESSGWKGEHQTAIASQHTHEKFFREIADGFAKRGRLLFGELSVDDQVIASTCNLQAGNVLFAFKIGWNPDFAKGSPGNWSEIELATSVQRVDSSISHIDSCSSEDSYTASLWPGRCRIASTAYTWSRRACALYTARQQLRPVRRVIS